MTKVTFGVVHNVADRRYDCIKSFEVEPLIYGLLTKDDIGRTVIYQDHGRAEAGTLSSWRNGVVFARFHKGDTAAGCDPLDLLFAVRRLGNDKAN